MFMLIAAAKGETAAFDCSTFGCQGGGTGLGFGNQYKNFAGGIYAFAETAANQPRALLGLNDLSARLSVRQLLKQDVMTFAVPYTLYRDMEDNVPGSFVERHTWRQLREVT